MCAKFSVAGSQQQAKGIASQMVAVILRALTSHGSVYTVLTIIVPWLRSLSRCELDMRVKTEMPSKLGDSCIKVLLFFAER